MALYEFRCNDCGYEFEEFQNIRDEKPMPCKKCGGETGRKISVTNTIYKGSGFYVTDYKK